MRKIFGLCQILGVAVLAINCSGRPVDLEHEPTENPGGLSKDQKIETLTKELSKAKSRIEELDAKLSSLTDRVESAGNTVDNVVVNKEVHAQKVGVNAGVVGGSDTEELAIKAEALSPQRLDSASNDFFKAMNLFKNARFSDASVAFARFTETYPEHALAGSAQYYSGEAHLQMGDFKGALNDYGKVISSFASSPRVPSALVRMAQAYEALGSKNESARTYALARDLYVGHPALDALPLKKHPLTSNVVSAKAEAAKTTAQKIEEKKLSASAEAAVHSAENKQQAHEEAAGSAVHSSSSTASKTAATNEASIKSIVPSSAHPTSAKDELKVSPMAPSASPHPLKQVLEDEEE